jgi:hypothetical protein
LQSTIGAADVPIIYVIRPSHDDDEDWEPDVTNPAEVDMYAMRLDGPEYRQDRQAVFTLLYNCCNHERATGRREALAWIEPHIESQDGRAAFESFRAHFEGEGPSAMRRNQAFAQIKSLHWKNEGSMTFAAFSSALKNAYDIVSKDAAYSDEHKVRDLLDKIMPTSKVQQMEVVKGKVRDDYPTDFDRAISYIASRIAEIYADDIAKLTQYGIGKRNRQVYEAKSDNPGRGRGRGNPNGQRMAVRGGRGGGLNSGRAGRGGNHDRQHILFNGIDATDPNRPFSGPEWDQLGPNGRAYVTHERERLNGRAMTNRGGGRQSGRVGGRGNYRAGSGGGRNISEVTVQEQSGDASTVTSKGGRSGAGFGIGAYQGGRIAQD